MKRLFLHMVAAIISLWLATLLVPSVSIRALSTSNFFGMPLTETWEILILLGIVLGLLNFFLKPLLSALSFPLQILTLGIFGVLINIGLLWLLDYMFKELSIPWFLPLLYTTLIVWVLNLIAWFLIKND